VVYRGFLSVLLLSVAISLATGSVARSAGAPTVDIAGSFSGTSADVGGFCGGTTFTVSGALSTGGTYVGTITRNGECGAIDPGFTSDGPTFPVSAEFTFTGSWGSTIMKGHGTALLQVAGVHITYFDVNATLSAAPNQQTVGSVRLALIAGRNGYDSSTWSLGTIAGKLISHP
jgi:hypothetical protein